MFARLYKDGGLQTTADRAVTIAQGAAVGGSTVVNNAIWLRADLDRVLPAWSALGAAVPKQAIMDAYQELEANLHVSPVSPALANPGAHPFLEGCKQLGIQAGFLDNNRHNCIACGWCNYGCRYNRKTSMLVTYIPWAESRGAVFIDQCRDVRLATRGDTVTSVSFLREGTQQRLESDRVVVCAGAIGSSVVLLQSGITAGGNVGKGLHLLGGVLVTGEMREVVDGFDGIALTCSAHIDADVIIETYFAPPTVFSLTLNGWLSEHFERMLRYRYFAQAGVMVATQPTGRVSLDRRGRTRIELTFARDDVARLRDGMKALANIWFAGGAARVFPATFKSLELLSPADLGLIDETVQAPRDLLLGSAHPQGGNAMSDTPTHGVVDERFKVHGFKNLHVADASVFPSNIVANCQATVMAMSHYAAAVIAE